MTADSRRQAASIEQFLAGVLMAWLVLAVVGLLKNYIPCEVDVRSAQSLDQQKYDSALLSTTRTGVGAPAYTARNGR